MSSGRVSDAACLLALSLGVLSIVLGAASLEAGIVCIALALAVSLVVWAATR
jgi:hypothetical protein